MEALHGEAHGVASGIQSTEWRLRRSLGAASCVAAKKKLRRGKARLKRDVGKARVRETKRNMVALRRSTTTW